MKKKVLFSIVFACLTIINFSCTKEPDVNPQEEATITNLNELEMVDGLIKFNNEDQFATALSKIPNMTDEELDNWENRMGFVSHRSMVNSFYDELDYTVNESEFNESKFYNLLEKYSDYVELIDGPDGQEIIRKLENKFYASITDYRSIYLTEDRANKVVGNSVISGDIKYLSSLINLNNEDVTTEANLNELMIHRYGDVHLSKQLKTDRCWSHEIYDWGWYDVGGCSSDRRVKLQITCNVYQYVDLAYYVESHVKLIGQEKLGWVCTWKDYKTNLTWRNIEYDLIVDGYVFHYESDFYDGDDVYSLDYYTNKRLTTYGQSYSFDNVSGEGTSRGVDGWNGHQAELNCFN